MSQIKVAIKGTTLLSNSAAVSRPDTISNIQQNKRALQRVNSKINRNLLKSKQIHTKTNGLGKGKLQKCYHCGSDSYLLCKAKNAIPVLK